MLLVSLKIEGHVYALPTSRPLSPWATPCASMTLSKRNTSVTDIPSVDLNSALANIVLKIRQLKDSVQSYQQKIIAIRLQDPDLLQRLDNSTITGFPSTLPRTGRESLDNLMEDYGRLSHIGEYITLMKIGESDPSFARDVIVIKNQLMNLLCEINTTIVGKGGNLTYVFNALSHEARNPSSLTDRHYRDYIIIKDFKTVLNSLVIQYAA